MNKRPDKISYYFQIAKDVASRSPCISRRRFGAIIVKDDAMISSGYAGSVRGAINCGIDCLCLKDLYNEERYKSYEHCSSVHGEMNAIINAGRVGVSVIGATMFLSEVNDDNERPCRRCRQFIIQAGIKDVWYYKRKIGKETYENIPFNFTDNPHLEICYEKVIDWIKLEDEWIQNQLRDALK